jgi:O-antigen ligase
MKDRLHRPPPVFGLDTTVATQATSRRGSLLRWPEVTALFAPLLGAAVAVAVLLTARLDLRHSFVVLGAVALASVLVAARDKERILACVFVLSLGTNDLVLRLSSDYLGPAIPLDVLLGLVLFAWCVGIGKPERLRHPLRWLGSLRFPIVAVLATSALSLVGTSERLVGLAQMLTDVQAYLIYVIALNMATSSQRIRNMIIMLFVSLTVQSLISVGQIAAHWAENAAALVVPPQAVGTVGGNPAHLVNFIMPILMIALGYLATVRRPAQVFPLAAVTAIGTVALALTLKRAAWVGFALGLGLIIARTRHARMLARQRRRLLQIAGLATLIGLLLWPMMAMRLDKSSVTDAYDERSVLMHIALRVIAANPLVGVGDGVYAHAYKSFARAEIGEHWLSFVHDQYLLRAAETGIPGLIALLSLIAFALRQAWRLSRSHERDVASTALGWSAALVALFWHMVWERWQLFSDVAVFWFVLGLIEGAEINQRRPPSGVSAASEHVSSPPLGAMLTSDR